MIVQAFVSVPTPLGLFSSVKSLTCVPDAIVAVTAPVVSAAIDFAFATLKPTPAFTVTV